jgi:hypothetical protein
MAGAMRLFCDDAPVRNRAAIYTAFSALFFMTPFLIATLPPLFDRASAVSLFERSAMDVTSIASLATNLSAAKTEQEVGIAVLKKAMDVESAGAIALINAIPSAANLPANLGQNINIAV